MKYVTCHVLLQELRAKVAECHKQIGELDQQLRDKEESHAAEVEERRRELQDLQERVGSPRCKAPRCPQHSDCADHSLH